MGDSHSDIEHRKFDKMVVNGRLNAYVPTKCQFNVQGNLNRLSLYWDICHC